MRSIILAIFICLSGFLQAQTTCETCDSITLDGSAFPSGLVYAWSCTDGQTSNLQTKRIEVTEDMTCTLVVTDTITGCVSTSSVIINMCPDECNLLVNVNLSGTVLLATTQNCEGTATYQWQKWNGSIWVNVGSNTPTYNTSGVSGLYKSIVTCAFGCEGEAEINYTSPCNVNISTFAPNGNMTALYWIVTGCSGTVQATIYKENPIGSGTWDSLGVVSHSGNQGQFTYSVVAGNYRVRVICNGCTSYRVLNYNPCAGFTGLTITANTQDGVFESCIPDTVLFSPSIVGGYTYSSYEWKKNGTTIGTASTQSVIFNAEDNAVISLTVTATNGCTAVASRIFYARDCCPTTLSLSPLASTVCSNQNITFTAVGTGETPLVYNWSSTRLGVVSSQGSGNPKVMNFTTPGAYTITVNLTDQAGCQNTASTTLTVNSCTDCTCSPLLAQVGCALVATFTGSGCTDYNYVLEYSLTGTSWSTVVSGLATGPFTHTPTANGLFRLRINKTGCSALQTPIVNITCFVAPCAGAPTLTLNGTNTTICSLLPETVTGNTFGGSATSVTLSENGNGTLNISSAGSSPFSWTYTPAAGDLGTTVTVTITTNNPNGFPCIPITRTYALNYLAVPAPTITSSTAALCPGTTRLITYSTLGGVLTVQSGPGFLTGNILTSTGSGSIVLSYVVNNGPCAGSATQILSTVCCTGIAMTITTKPDSVAVGTLNYLGTEMANYHIEWRKVSDNSVVFRSGKGTGLHSGAITHPIAYKYLNDAEYYAYIVTSTIGANLDCFDNFIICPKIPVTHTENFWYDFENLFSITPIDWGYTCFDPEDRLIYGQNPGGVNVTAPAFITNTFTAAEPVTWTVENLSTPPTPAGNMTILSQTATTITFKLQWIESPENGAVVCGVTQSGNFRYNKKLTARNACGQVVYRVYILGQIVG